MPALPTLDQRMPDWNAVWVFLQLNRSGSFRACAKRYNMTINSIRRQIDRLEHQVGFRVLTRHVDGIRLTPEGERLLGIAQNMEREAVGLVWTREALSDLEGAVRIAVTEGLGAVWLTPRVVEFQRAHPRLRVDLACAMSSADILRMEADLAIQLSRPEAPDVRGGPAWVHARDALRLARLCWAIRAPVHHRGTGHAPARPACRRSDLHRRDPAQHVRRSSVQRKRGDDDQHQHSPCAGTRQRRRHRTFTHLRDATPDGFDPVDCGMRARLDIWLTYHPDAEASLGSALPSAGSDRASTLVGSLSLAKNGFTPICCPRSPNMSRWRIGWPRMPETGNAWARCRYCGGANRAVVNGGVGPCRSLEEARLYSTSRSLPCMAALEAQARPAGAESEEAGLEARSRTGDRTSEEDAW